MKTVEDICGFLSSRCIPDIVLENIRQQKIDGDVVRVLDESQLIEVGITALGDRSMLRNFCQSDSNTTQPINQPTAVASTPSTTTCRPSSDRRAYLLKCLRENYGSQRQRFQNREKRSHASKGRPVSMKRAVEMRLRILCKQDDGTVTHPGRRDSKPVKKPLGDKNMINLKIDPSIGYEQFLEIVKEAFFPGGMNPVVGDIDLFQGFELVDGLNINICTGLQDFSLNKYIEKKNTSGALRLNLLLSMVEPEPHADDPTVTGMIESDPDPDYLPDLDIKSEHIATSPSGEVLIRRNQCRRASPQATRPAAAPVPSTATLEPAFAQPSASSADNTAHRRHLIYSDLLVESDEEEDDEDLNLAIAASLADASKRHEETTLTDLLVELSSRVDKTCQPNLINVARSRLLAAACRAFGRQRFQPTHPLSLKFMDDIGQSEGAIDDGGPTQEFFTLLLRKFQENGMFEGPDDRKIIVPYQPAKKNDLYYFCGYTMALAMVHVSKGPHFISPTMYDAITKGPEAVHPTFDDVHPLEIRNMLMKINEATNMDELHKAMDDASTFLDISGCYIPIRTLVDKEVVVTASVKFQVLTRIREFMDRFVAGLSVLGVYQRIKENPDIFRPIWCFKPERLTVDTIKNLFVQALPEPGHNLRDRSACVLAFWYDYLEDVQEGNCQAELKDILFFATGVEYVPPLGFNTQPTLEFHQEGKFPMASTCECQLRLPLDEIENYDRFKSNMDEGFLNTVGFGRA
ncbi:G2/M phase-specific E3 ubiquitin-protein ligase-like [Lineus longissimus]|uniref:G2/M phase-specific E3 ubiquitin-protein ligase-like n=1 Tax=Lineus longissimus TaxID=88925 RepID=UPI002B4DC3F1